MKKIFTFIAVAAMAFAANAAELTICDGGYYSPSVPIYGLWADTEGTMGQMIYPAEMLEDMVGQEITEVKFYTTAYYYNNYGDPSYIGSSDYINFEGATVQLAFMIVENGFEGMAIYGAAPVATTEPVVGEENVTFQLDQPFVYEGGDLLIECKIIETEGDYGTTYFYGAGFEEGTNCCYYGYNGYSGWNESIFDFLPMVTFTYQEGETPEPPVVDQVGAPTFEGYTEDGVYGYGVNILPTTEGSSIMYRVLIDVDGEWVVVTDWTQYMGTPMEIWMSQELAKYRIEAYAFIGDVISTTVAYEYQVQPWTSINEMNAGKTVAGVRYFNLAGQEMQEANGMTIVVTTYTDGTTSAVKVMK
jgi:hypothetical protein